MRFMLLLLAACGGGSSGSFEATVNIGGVPTMFSEPCEITEMDTYWDIHANQGSKLAFEMKWKKTAITAVGTYTSTGIVDVITLFTLHVPPGETESKISTAAGMVTFTTYNPKSAIDGTFELAVGTELTASGSFECR